MDFHLVNPADLRAHWGHLSRSLHAVQKASPEDWIAEDVYHAIKSGAAACHIALNDHGYAGCMVTLLTRTEYSGECELHCWIAHNVGEADVIAEGVGMLREMAKKAGAKRITFGSSRLGWGKRYKLKSAVYEIPMEEG